MSNNKTNYKGFLLRQLGLKESQFPPSDVNPDVFPGIDPAGDEPFKKDPETHVSPSAKRPPILGISIRGSVTGGLPSGNDNALLGGYSPIKPDSDNSVVVDKTPQNGGISSNKPISKQDDAQTDQGGEHPHQVQKDAGEAPQSVTGAEEDGNGEGTSSITPSANDQGEVDINVDEEDDDDDKNETSKTGALDMADDAIAIGMGATKTAEKSLQEGKHKSGCKCGFCANKGKFENKKVSDEKLDEIIKSLTPKAISGKMNLQESKVFSAIKQVIEKRRNSK